MPLDQYLAAHPRQILGAHASAAAEMPFLLKVLAADAPLSIQVHPSEEQARDGFAREQRAGLGPNAPERSYRDPHAKPELVCALEPFTALWGFRQPAEISATLRPIGHPVLAGLAAALETDDAALALESLLARVLSYRERFDPDLAPVVAAAVSEHDPQAAHWIERLANHHPDDPCVLAPLFLNLVELAPGEALATGPGLLHSYLHGAAVELMGCSDNVVRCGLTSKHVDAAELMRLVRFEPSLPRVDPGLETGSGCRIYRGDAGLELERIESGAEPIVRRRATHAPEIVLDVEGAIEVRTRRGEVATTLSLRPHDAALVPAITPAYEIAGSGLVFRASRSSA